MHTISINLMKKRERSDRSEDSHSGRRPWLINISKDVLLDRKQDVYDIFYYMVTKPYKDGMFSSRLIALWLLPEATNLLGKNMTKIYK